MSSNEYSMKELVDVSSLRLQLGDEITIPIFCAVLLKKPLEGL